MWVGPSNRGRLVPTTGSGILPSDPSMTLVRRQQIALATALGLATTVASGCEGPAQPTTDDREATFEAVFAVFDANGCATAGCHGGDDLAAELDLDGLAVAHAQLVDVRCANTDADSKGLLRVTSGQTDASFLLTKLALTTNDPTLGLPMPPTGEFLEDADIDLVRRWIEAGAPAPGE